MKIRKKIREWQTRRAEVVKAKNVHANGRMHLYHFWGIEPDEFWLCNFLRECGLLEKTDKTIGFWSVFGDRRLIDEVSDDINIFFTGENVHIDERMEYADYLLMHPKVQLALGFDYFENQKYLRMPLWMMYSFGDCFTYDDICKRCKELRYPNVDNKNKWICAISSWDPNGVRGEIANVLEFVKTVDYAGKWRHNDDTLKSVYHDNKIEYMRSYVFNICPENSNSMGYVTEKLFEAITAGCIPVYWGSYNDPEPGIINKDVILFYDGNNDEELRLQMNRLVEDENYRISFMKQPRLLSGAEDKIWAMMNAFKEKMMCLI